MLIEKNIEILPEETILDDNFPVYAGYCYIVDGNLHSSDVFGTVRDLRRSVFQEFGQANEVRRYQMFAVRKKK